VWFAVFFVLLAASLGFAHRPAVAETLRASAIGAGGVAAVMAWRAGGRGRGILLGLITLAAGLALPAPPVPAEGEQSGVHWFFLAIGVVVLVGSLVQTLREGREKAAPRD
jgi:hypothetical protein